MVQTNNTTKKMFLTHRPEVMRWEERDLSEYRKNLLNFCTVCLSIERKVS